MDKKTAVLMMKADLASFHQVSLEISKTAKDLELNAKNYFQDLVTQITTGSVSLLSKTPKLPKKRTTRIKAIPENDEMETDTFSTTYSSNSSQQDNMTLEVSDVRSGRAKRGASIRAADNIKKQQLITLSTKLRRPSKENNDESLARKSLKRKLQEQDDDTNTTLTSDKSTRQNSLPKSEPAAKKAHYSKSPPRKHEKAWKHISTLEKISEGPNSPKQSQQSVSRATTSTSSSSSIIKAQNSHKNKMHNVINETVDMSNADETLASLYEDAIGKPLPIMNSTMNPDTTVTLDKMMNVTVLLEPLGSKKVLNETVTIKKSVFKEPVSQKKNTVKDTLEIKNGDDKLASIPSSERRSSRNKSTPLKTQKDLKIDKFNELITDDESSPERKGYSHKKPSATQQKRVTRSNSSLINDENEVPCTPVALHKISKDFKMPSAKSAYKSAALFSPYAKDSVKKRVEAFELVAKSPNQGDIEITGRVTRTKTRALAAASEIPVSTITQKLARKSLAKAKKISLAKQTKEYEDTKENEHTNIKSKKMSSLEKSSQKSQSKITPLGKSRLLPPSSANKNQYATPSNVQTLNTYSKPLTASRGNIVTHIDSFIQPMKSASKQIDKAIEEKRRRAYDEDARRKREEILKAQAEEKRRKREEKELKNKLAREAKEKLEYEKRLKAEREREEKAKLAQQLQEKQKEEMEKKRTAQLQKALEKEERRKQEEYLRMLRLQEQEEQERSLAEQKRREQELEKRKQAELRHQYAEMKMKNQLDKAALQSKAKTLAAQKQATYNYKIDSDPDEEDTDDESKPKHQIPPWALKNVRQIQLAMQQYIPMKSVLSFFDVKKCTPDLRELFKGIDPKKLKRSSSAIWRTPPRISMMEKSIIKG